MGPVIDLLTTAARTSRSSVIREILALVESDDVLSLAGGMPDPVTFPVEALVEAAALAIRAPTGAALQYGRTEGLTTLRERIAAETSARRSRPAHHEEVLVTTGSQQALDLVARAFLEPGDEVAVDDPGYLGAVQALGGQRPRWLPIPVDRDGLDTGVLEDVLLSGRRPKLVYTVTDFQNPTGAVLHLDRRQHLAALAEHWGFVVVEDDPYGKIRFGEPELPPVATWTERAISLGTTSKTIAPGLRVGWSVAPAEVTSVLARLKQACDLHTSTLSQHLVDHLLSTPDWMVRHSADLAAFYAPRASALRDAVVATVPDCSISEARGGLFLWCDLPGVDTGALLPRAVSAGVAFVPGSAFSTCEPSGARSDPSATTMRLTFATLSEGHLREAVSRLASVV